MPNNRTQSEPRWQRAECLAPGRVPRGLLDWLLDPASLTSRLQQLCGSGFRVQLLTQNWRRPMLNEYRVLPMRFGTLGLVREVKLYCDREPWVFARTVIPHRTLRGRNRRLGQLGNRPLGAVLFADKSMRRGPLELACVQPGQALFERAVSGLDAMPDAIWGRRSVFYVSDKPLLVSEIFLPPVLCCGK